MTSLAAAIPPNHRDPMAQPAAAAAAAAPLTTSSSADDELSLARQILHNLQHQHHWSALQVHTNSPVTNAPLPRPLLSGLPAQRLYVHPDEQVELLKQADSRKKAGESKTLDVIAQPELEWVLPTRLNEKWSLQRLAEVFDAITLVPEEQSKTSDQEQPPNPWRTTKRVVLATVDSDSTVTYYIVHDGVVKPRQN